MMHTIALSLFAFLAATPLVAQTRALEMQATLPSVDGSTLNSTNRIDNPAIEALVTLPSKSLVGLAQEELSAESSEPGTAATPTPLPPRKD